MILFPLLRIHFVTLGLPSRINTTLAVSKATLTQRPTFKSTTSQHRFNERVQTQSLAMAKRYSRNSNRLNKSFRKAQMKEHPPKQFYDIQTKPKALTVSNETIEESKKDSRRTSTAADVSLSPIALELGNYDLCDGSYDNGKKLVRHYRAIHSQHTFKCEVCNTSTLSSVELCIHFGKDHKGNGMTKQTQVSTQVKPQEPQLITSQDKAKSKMVSTKSASQNLYNQKQQTKFKELPIFHPKHPSRNRMRATGFSVVQVPSFKSSYRHESTPQILTA